MLPSFEAQGGHGPVGGMTQPFPFCEGAFGRAFPFRAQGGHGPLLGMTQSAAYAVSTIVVEANKTPLNTKSVAKNNNDVLSFISHSSSLIGLFAKVLFPITVPNDRFPSISMRQYPVKPSIIVRHRPSNCSGLALR